MLKLGIQSAILGDLSFDEVIDICIRQWFCMRGNDVLA